VSLPAQVAAVKALEHPDYYAVRYTETHVLREDLAKSLKALNWKVLPSVANFLLCEMEIGGPSVRDLIQRCRQYGLFLRDPGNMGNLPSGHMIRIAVKDKDTNRQMVKIINNSLNELKPKSTD